MKRILLWILLLSILTAPGCGGGGRRISQLSPQQPVLQDSIQQSTPERNVLSATMPSLAGMSSGSEFEFTLSAQLAEETKQGCGRIIYDSAVATPVSVEKGGLIPSSFVFFSKMDAPGVVPFAFTSLPDQRGISPGKGELLRVRFRMLQTPPPGFKIRLQNDGAFLQLRSAAGGRMSFDLSSEVLAR
jgi:hypothetical protein